MKQISAKFKKPFVYLQKLFTKNKLAGARFLHANKILILAIFILGLVMDILINSRISDLAILLLIGIWIINIFNLKLSPRHSLFLAGIIYFMAPINRFLGNDRIVEKSASWFFIFLSISFIQKIFDAHNKGEKRA